MNKNLTVKTQVFQIISDYDSDTVSFKTFDFGHKVALKVLRGFPFPVKAIAGGLNVSQSAKFLFI